MYFTFLVKDTRKPSIGYQPRKVYTKSNHHDDFITNYNNLPNQNICRKRIASLRCATSSCRMCRSVGLSRTSPYRNLKYPLNAWRIYWSQGQSKHSDVDESVSDILAMSFLSIVRRYQLIYLLTFFLAIPRTAHKVQLCALCGLSPHSS
jgi:hypothetical protein